MPAPQPPFTADLAALAWQIDLGADEAIGEAPVDRFSARAAPGASAAGPAASEAAAPAAAPAAETAVEPAVEPGAPAEIAAACADLPALRAALAGFEGCALKKGARNLVFADGAPEARVMIVGEAPGRDEDIAGLPFVGRSGQLLDRMFAAIGLSRRAERAAEAIYITNLLPWRPPQNRDPSGDEVAMLLPFLIRHIELAAPDLLVPMGNAATRALLGTEAGITRLRGRWADWRGVPVLPMFHPAALLRMPEHKRLAWTDLLALRARLEGSGGG